jgi:hypothetical protein
MIWDDEGGSAESHLDYCLVVHAFLPARSQEYPLVRSSFLFQMEAPRRLPLDTSKRTICGPFLCQAIIDHMNGKISTTFPKHGKTLNCFAPRPQMEIPQAVSRQVSPADPDCESLVAHGGLKANVGASILDVRP